MDDRTGMAGAISSAAVVELLAGFVSGVEVVAFAVLVISVDGPVADVTISSALM